MTDLAGWIGCTRTDTAILDPEIARRFAAAIGADLAVAAALSTLGHWAYFNDASRAVRALGRDGHPEARRASCRLELPRRMFASATLRFRGAAGAGRGGGALADHRRRPPPLGPDPGDLVLVDVERRLSQGGALKLAETQTIVYREAGEPTPAVPNDGSAGRQGEPWAPSPVDLFRYSAATFNSHRIHYDQTLRPRARRAIPTSWSRGPFTAARLCDLAARTAGAPLRSVQLPAPWRRCS